MTWIRTCSVRSLERASTRILSRFVESDIPATRATLCAITELTRIQTEMCDESTPTRRLIRELLDLASLIEQELLNEA